MGSFLFSLADRHNHRREFVVFTETPLGAEYVNCTIFFIVAFCRELSRLNFCELESIFPCFYSHFRIFDQAFILFATKNSIINYDSGIDFIFRDRGSC